MSTSPAAPAAQDPDHLGGPARAGAGSGAGATAAAGTAAAATAGTGATAEASVRWSRYVALGDSMTEGLWDVDPAAPGYPRGWADLLAERLAQRRLEPVEYANLAVRGRLLGGIIAEQLPAALELSPDLVSLIGGGNDLLRPGSDPDALAERLEAAVQRVRAAGADVLLGTGMDTRYSGVLRATRSRTAVYNSHVWAIARRHGAYVLDLWGMRALRDWRMWAEDRIHLTTAGHERVTQAALVALGLGADDPAWDDPLEPLPPVARAERLRGDLEWARTYAYPWVGRRLRRRSSGDARRPKRPVPTAVGASSSDTPGRPPAAE